MPGRSFSHLEPFDLLLERGSPGVEIGNDGQQTDVVAVHLTLRCRGLPRKASLIRKCPPKARCSPSAAAPERNAIHEEQEKEIATDPDFSLAFAVGQRYAVRQ